MIIMKLLLDSANIDEIKEIVDYGFIDGVTTNPELLAKEVLKGSDTEKIITDITKIVNGEVHIQVTSNNYDDIIKQAVKIHSMGMNVIVKIPVTFNGIKAIKALKDKNIKTTATVIFNSLQALIAAKNNADYVAPYISSIDNIGSDGVKTVSTIKAIFNNYDIKTKILAAAINNPVQIVRCGLMGIDAVTMPYSIIKKLPDYPETSINIKNFENKWSEIPENSRTFFNK